MLRFVTAFAGALALLMVGLAGPALAQGQRPTGGLITSGVIQRIVVEGNNRVESDTVRSYLTVATGDPFDTGKMDASLKTLFATGLFADVSFARQGDDLVIKVVENPIINRIAFEGNRRLDDDALRQDVQLRPRVVFTRAKVQADVKRVLELYRRSGRFAVQVEPKIIQLEPQDPIRVGLGQVERPAIQRHRHPIRELESPGDVGWVQINWACGER